MLARRLPVGGALAFGPPVAEPQPFLLLAAPEAAWPSATQAFYNAGKSIFGTVTNSGSARIVAYDHASGVATSTQVGVLGADQHNSPCVLRRSSDGRYVAAMCNHTGAQMWVTISDNPDDSTAWGETVNVDSQLGGSGYTYPALFQLGDETNDPIYMFYRVQDGIENWCISSSTDGGDTWSTLTNLSFGTRYYARVYKTSESRLDFAITDGSYAEDFASMYHFYYEGGDYFATDGTQLAGSPPFDVTDFTLIYDGSTSGARFPNSIVNDGSEIAVVFMAQTGTPTNHVGEDGDYIYCRWDGASWSAETIVADVGATDLEFTEGGVVVDPADIDRVILSKRGAGGTGTWHLWEYVTADGGASWTPTQLTSTGDEDRYPWFVDGYQSGLEFIWQKGEFIDSLNFDAAVWGYGAP